MDIPTFKEVFEPIRQSFWILGTPLNKSRIKIRYFVFLLASISIIIAEAAFFVSKIAPENFLILVDLAPCLVNGINTIIKNVCIVLKRHKIVELATTLENINDDSLKDVRKSNVTKQRSVFLMKLVKYYYILNAILISVYNFVTLIVIIYYYVKTKDMLYLLPYPILVPFATDSWKPWLLVYLHSIGCGFAIVICSTAIDTLYCVLTSHVCSSFEVLSDDIMSLDKTNNHKLAEIVKSHQNILKLSDDLEDIFEKPNLSNVLSGSINICALGFNLTVGDTSRIPGVALFLISILLQMLLISEFGDNLIKESTKVADSAFLSKWYEMDERSKKQILIIMKRSSKPQKLTAYKFSILGYDSFSKIISTSWSYLTILKTVYKPPK